MAASGVSESILFATGLVVAVTFVGIFAAVVSDAGQDVRQQGHRVSDGYATEIVILNDPQAMQASPLVLYVRNTGQTSLTPDATTILVNGIVAMDVAFDGLQGAEDGTWPPGTVVEITVSDVTLAAGEHRVRVVTEHGVEDSIRFRVV